MFEILAKGCEEHVWYSEPEVGGAEFERMAFSFTVTAPDRWWCHRLALRLADRACFWMGMPVPVPEWEALAPHTNRGYGRVPRNT